jgi:hypothetical protein
MARDERARHELFLRLEQVVGRESAETLMEMLPLRFELVDQRFEASENKLLAAFRAELLAQSNVNQCADEGADQGQSGHGAVDGRTRFRCREAHLSS